ncbi:MAG TPA: DUF6231 family protein [Thiobacillaceae bacterium]|nr:DUF6231 family protein [Thiobacillaceae bacterium]
MNDWQHLLEELIEQRKPRRILVSGLSLAAWADNWSFSFRAQRVAEPPADLALLSLPELPLEEISRARDRCPCVVVLTESCAGADFNTFLALGLERLYESADGAIHLYRHDIATYKAVPDWLNAKYWAHPERWEP